MEINVIASGSSGNAYFISDGVTSVLLDAGIPRSGIHAALGRKFLDIDAVLITHSHMDHAIAAAELAKLGTNVYMSFGEAEALGLRGHRIRYVKALERFEVGTFTIIPFNVEHDSPEPLGFLIRSGETRENLLYFTDTFYLKYQFAKVDIMICECNHSREIIDRNLAEGTVLPSLAARLAQSHMSIDRLSEYIRRMDKSRLREIDLVHISESNGDPEAFTKRIMALTGAEVYPH